MDLPVAATFNIQVACNNTWFFKIGIYNISINYFVLLDAPEILVNRNWVHAGLGSFAELECNVYAKPMAQVKLKQTFTD